MAIEGGLQMGTLGVSLIVQDVAAAADFYRDVLGAEELERDVGEVPGAGWQVTSAQMRLGDVRLMVVRENPRWREAPRADWPRSPVSAGAPSVWLTLDVADVDAVFGRALAAGATPHKSGGVPEDTHWGDRIVQFYDPSGHVWRIRTRIGDIAAADSSHRREAARRPN